MEKYFNFTKYPIKDESPWGLDFILYYKDDNSKPIYIEATYEQKIDKTTIVYEKQTFIYTELDEIKKQTYNINEFFIKSSTDLYISSKNFIPNKNYNWIYGDPDKHAYVEGDDTSEKIATYPINIYKIGNYIPDESNEYKYDSINLASIQIPSLLIDHKTNFNCKYNYTLIPCMNYGKLDHLAVSGTVNFQNLFNFNKSNFNVWKYRIDGKQLRLTFGAEIYDTFENDKVDALILEFYDLYGFAGSLEITDKRSYSGIFTKLIQLDSIGGLNKKKISGNKYIENYVHSIYINNNSNDDTKTSDEFKYNDKIVNHDFEKGWYFTSNNSNDIIENDCGTLYSNMLYGVKLYFRRTKNKGTENEKIEFIRPKTNSGAEQEFFLFTFPIFNDYYYKYDNYHNNLLNPKLDLTLTYKLINSGSVTPFNSEGDLTIINGYNNTDYDNINTYTSGNYSEQTLKLTRYYNYSGTSKLYLEIGLGENYKELNISYDPVINNYFTCDL
jgi:hypothetical protein